MKIIYLGSISTTDSDFPLIRALQQKGVDIICYFPLLGKKAKSGLISVENIPKRDEIVHATEYNSFKKFENYFKLDNIYVINNYHNKRYHWQSWVIWLKFMFHAKKFNPDAFHYVWPFAGRRKVLYFWKIKKVFTVHDPFVHSSQRSLELEKTRIQAFKSADKLVLLSPIFKIQFCDFYQIPQNNIYISKLGYYDWLSFVDDCQINVQSPYILFFGQIQAHKGVDILLEAMREVHKLLPQLRCIIAGKGEFSFDINIYKSCRYLEFRNYFIEIPELVELLKNCLFAVAPYKDATQSGVVQTAFSLGVPMIVTNVGALPNSVTNGVTGFVVPPCDVRELSRVIISLTKDNTSLTKFRNNIENGWKKKMQWDDIADGYVHLYQNLINMSSACDLEI